MSLEIINSSVQAVEIPVTDVEIGMYVNELDIPWLESPFIYQGFIVETKQQLEQLKSVCHFVSVDVRKSTNKRMPKSARSGDYEVSVERELGAANGVRESTRKLVKNIFQEIELGKGIDGNKVQDVVHETVDSVLRNPDALTLLTQIKNKDEYTAEHSMNVSILSAAFGRYMGMSRVEIEEIAYCALLHDVGKIRVPTEILNKEGALNGDEFGIMKKHTVFGRAILMASDAMMTPAVDVAYAHHERMDGTGYPRQLPRENIPQLAKLIAITDAYDAITSTRCYKSARSPFEALTVIYDNRGRQFDDKLTEKFVECVGVYPPGSIVEMTNGEIGIVLSVHPEHKLNPRVIMVRDAEKKPRHERIVHLRHADLDGEGAPYKVRKTHANGEFGVSLKEYLERGLRLGEHPPTGIQAAVLNVSESA
ncbi:MAG: HD-GYP domain-containing protein [Gammaproteobacteria bacterium]|nr:HD-GYP domain-containing protein [Gammaproteobacteria bacterium]